MATGNHVAPLFEIMRQPWIVLETDELTVLIERVDDPPALPLHFTCQNVLRRYQGQLT